MRLAFLYMLEIFIWAIVENQNIIVLIVNSLALCLIPQCGQPCYVDPKTGTSETFCGQVHSKQAYKQSKL